MGIQDPVALPLMCALIHMDYYIDDALEIIDNFIKAKTINNNSWW